MNVKNIGLRMCKGVGEGPHYDSEKDELYFVDIRDYLEEGTHGSIFRKTLIQSAETSNFSQCDMGENFTTFAIPTVSGKVLVGYNQSIAEVDWPRDGSPSSHTIMHTVEEGKPTRFNDAKCDPRGRLLAGTMSLDKALGVPVAEGIAALYGIDTDRSIRVIGDQYTLCNGLAWTADNKSMFFIDSIMNKVFLFDYDIENFTASNRRTVFDASQHSDLNGAFPDGCCIDVNDNLWVACYFGGRVFSLDTRTGKRIEEIKLPTRNPTSCCFAGSHLNELIITTSNLPVDKTDVEAGSIYRVSNMNTRGFPMVKFHG